MPKFYQMRDSLLESVEQEGDRVLMNLRAIRAEIAAGSRRPADTLRQEIRLVLEGAQLSVDSANWPSWLLEGALTAEVLDADPGDCGVKGTIPVSLRAASGVELVLSGLHEGSGDFVTIRVRAGSLRLEPLSEPQSLQHTRATI